MSNYLEPYFDNILSRSWTGKRETLVRSIEQSELQDIYFEKSINDKIVLIGKTEKFYFILECFDSDGYKYSNGLFNDSLVNLIYGYKDRNSIIYSDNVEKFVDSLLLTINLQKNLTIKSEIVKNKPRKI